MALARSLRTARTGDADSVSCASRDGDENDAPTASDARGVYVTALRKGGMAEILAENLSGKDVMGTDGTEIGSLYNITMDISSGTLYNLVIDPAESLRNTDFEYTDQGRLLIPVERVKAVKDHMIVNR